MRPYTRQTGLSVSAHPSFPITHQIMEDTLAGKYVVCRICEGVIQEEYLAAHTALCRYVVLTRSSWLCCISACG